jgi:lipoyl(octanoyl) transferase
MGVHISRWVTSHGFAFNVSTDLRFFDHIVPCGLRDKGVTSLERLLGRPVEMDCVVDSVIEHFEKVFEFAMEFERSKVESRESAVRNAALDS